jgi:SAM-dependent methyltransferase
MIRLRREPPSSFAVEWPVASEGDARDLDPWLRIPAADYEAHMRAVGQEAALREIFAGVYAETRPARLAVLGCTTGGDLALVQPAVTRLAVGVDLNADYLALAAERLGALGQRLRLVCGDVACAELPPGPYDLVHAALLLEYVDPPSLLGRISEWLGPAGTFSLVTQEPVKGLPEVSDAGYASLNSLAGRMTLRSADEVAALAAQAGLALASRRAIKLDSGKKLVSSIFDKARPSLGRRRGRARC